MYMDGAYCAWIPPIRSSAFGSDRRRRSSSSCRARRARLSSRSLSVRRSPATPRTYPSRLRPDIAVGDLQQVAGRILEVERAPAAPPLLVVSDLDARAGQPVPPGLISLAIGGEQASVAGPGAAVVGDRAVARGGHLALEQQQDPGSGPERESARPVRDEGQGEQVRVEALDLLTLGGAVVEARLQDAAEPGGGRAHAPAGPPGGIARRARSRPRSV